MNARNMEKIFAEDDIVHSASIVPYLLSRKSKANGRQWGGSKPGKRRNKKRDFCARWKRFYEMYFKPDDSIFDDEDFRRRFRMRRELFIRLCERITDHDVFFQQNRDCTGKEGIHPYMKIIAAMRVLSYGCSADSLDENLEISETVILKCVKRFCKAVIEVFGEEYLRAPTEEDIETLLEENAARGFPGMVGSIDCMKWSWKNCPTAWRGAFQGKDGSAQVVLEAVASRDLWIWHAFVGMPGASNDINVLDASPLMSEYLDDEAPKFRYVVNAREYTFLYWLADGIYPEWSCFIRTISSPIGSAEEAFVKAQEAIRKDVERAFGVLQARFAIVARPARGWNLLDITNVMQCCIVLHNMIIHDDKETGRATTFSSYQVRHGRRSQDHIAVFSRIEPGEDFEVGTSFIEKFTEVQMSHKHHQLKRDLVQHIWDHHCS